MLPSGFSHHLVKTPERGDLLFLRQIHWGDRCYTQQGLRGGPLIDPACFNHMWGKFFSRVPQETSCRTFSGGFFLTAPIIRRGTPPCVVAPSPGGGFLPVWSHTYRRGVLTNWAPLG